ncbi:hypothetical protein X798_07236 [Onchocerca flexuosa]|uniref:Uncharacterized protein n=1 Tax=Onchocerca flexuosa TaxID=387005 RepID=A0A238BK14_9BILA|nr:hypothetical protein X798_07236 [Onchocerca flexuosa]
MSRSASPHPLSITYEEEMSEKQKQTLENIEVIGENNNMAAESVANLISPNARTNQQLRKDSGGWKSSGEHYRKTSFHGAHASFRLRMLQEQRIQPV